MNVTIPKKDLLRLVGRANAAADRKSTQPMLGCVLIEAAAKSITISATNLYISVRGSVAADVKTTGSIAVPAKDFLDRIKAMPDGPVQLSSTEGSAFVVKAAASARRYTLRGMPGDDFPPISAVTGDSQELKRAPLAAQLARAAFSISSDVTRASLNSLLVEWDGPTMRMISTDGHRLTVAGLLEDRMTKTMLVPLAAVTELRRLLEESTQETVALSVSGTDALFAFDGIELTLRLVDGAFPPYLQVIPADSKGLVRAPRAALADAIRAVSLAAKERLGIRFSGAPGVLKIHSENPESGDGSDEVAVDYDGPPFEIGLSARYVLDVLAAVDADTIDLAFGSDLDPVVFRPTGATDFLAVIMPMRID